MDQDRSVDPGDFDLEDPNLEEKLVNELKAQGIFDQFRKDCLSDVDTKPAYQNLRVRVDKSVSSYLSKTTWRPTLNKNQLRNQLRKYIQDMSGVEAGVDRIVDQIVNPKLNSSFLPEVENVIYNCFGTTKPEENEDDLVNGNDDHHENVTNGNNPNDSIGGKISTRNLSTISSDAEMLNMDQGSVGSSPGPGLAGHVSPLTPGASPHVNQGDISPLTPGQEPASTTPTGTPPPPPPGEDEVKVDTTEVVGMEVDDVDPEDPPRPQSAYTPPLPQPPPVVAGDKSPHTPPPAPSSTPPPPGAGSPPPAPAPADESGGEASMSSISDTDLGDVSPPQPQQPPPPPAPTQEAEVSKDGDSAGSDDDLVQLMKMKAELMAQLEGDFKLSPEESDEEEEAGAGNTEKVSSTSESPSPPPSTKGPQTPSPPGDDRTPSPPGEGMAKLSVSEEGCKPFSPGSSKSPDDGGASGGSGSGPGPSSGSGSGATTTVSKSSSGPSGDVPSTSGGQSEHKSHKHRDHHHSSSSSRSHHSSSSKHSSSSRHHSSSSMSKEEKKKYDKVKEQQKEKLKKYEEKIKSKDKMKSDKYQSLDIFSNTKKPSTPYQPLPHKTGNNSSGSSTPNTPGVRPPKKEFEKKLDEAIKKELERREEEKKKKQKEDEKLRSSFKTPNKIEERRSSGSDKERHSSDKIKDRRSSKNHESSSSKHRHDSEKDKHRRSSSDKERRHSSSSSSSSSSSDKKDYKRRESTDEKESKYSKERDQQEKESKRRLQEVRERKEKEEKERKRELERKQSHEKECDKNKPKDEINNLLKKRISSLGVDNIQKMLMESLVEKTGAKISEGEKQKMISKMEEMIKPSKEKVKSPPKKKSPVKKRSVSSSSSSSSSSDSSSSSSDSESDDELKEMKTRVKEGRKSIETPSSTSRPVRNRKIRTFQDDSEKSDTDSDFIQPVKKEEKVEAKETKTKVNNVAKPPVEAAVKSPPRIAKKDVDPQMPNFNYFTQEDVDKVSLIKDKYEKLLENEDELQVDDVTEEEINDAIPQTRIVSLEIDNNPQKMIETLSQFGGNPRLFTPIPDWLTPYLQGAKVKLEDVEMATKAEVAEYLSKKQTGKRKRKAGWDIVVDWVPDEQPLTKKSKIEKQLGFDFDSSFGCSINVNEGRRSRRSNMKYSDTSFTSEDDSAKPETQEITKKPKRNSRASIVVKDDGVNSIETTVMKMETEPGDKEELQVSPESPLNPEDRAEATSCPTESLDKEETNLPAESFEKEDTIIPSESLDKEETNVQCSNDDSSPGKKRRSKDIIAAYLNSAGVDRQEKVESEDKEEKREESQTDSDDVLKKLDEEINETDQELEAVLNSLRSKRKRSSSGDSKFHGWATEDIKCSKTGLSSMVETELKIGVGVDQDGASFGMMDVDFIQFAAVEGDSLLEVIFSPPIIQDVKKLQTSTNNVPETLNNKNVDKVNKINKNIVEPDHDDRGSNSPDSYGSSKENDPELCNSVSNVFKQTKAYSTRKKNSLKNPLLKPALEIS